MTGQFDLFSAPAPAPQAVTLPDPVTLLPSRPIAWEKLLRDTGMTQDVTLMVSWLWTGEVVESLSLGAEGRHLLHKDRRISEITPDPGFRGRVVFMAPDLARAAPETFPDVSPHPRRAQRLVSLRACGREHHGRAADAARAGS